MDKNKCYEPHVITTYVRGALVSYVVQNNMARCWCIDVSATHEAHVG